MTVVSCSLKDDTSSAWHEFQTVPYLTPAEIVTHVDSSERGLPLYEPQALLNYMEVISEFTKRELSFPKDIIPAISGVLSVLNHALNSVSLAGLPSSHLDTILLWNGEQMRRRPLNKETSSQLRLYPTWSWAGWIG